MNGNTPCYAVELTREQVEYMASFENAELTGECAANPEGAADQLNQFATQLLATMDANTAQAERIHELEAQVAEFKPAYILQEIRAGHYTIEPLDSPIPNSTTHDPDRTLRGEAR